LEGRSALAIFPTGGGKSLCYQLPALLPDGVTLVISPLIALMKDQVEALRTRGVSAARLDSSLTANEVAEVFDAMRNGTLKLLYIAPERLMNESFMERLSRLKIALLAIDEAHCISEWGHNFRPEYPASGRRGSALETASCADLDGDCHAFSRSRHSTRLRDCRSVIWCRRRSIGPNLNLHVTPVEIGQAA